VAASYSDVADKQLDEIGASENIDLCNGLITVCEWILDDPGWLRNSRAYSHWIRDCLSISGAGIQSLQSVLDERRPSVEVVFPHP